MTSNICYGNQWEGWCVTWYSWILEPNKLFNNRVKHQVSAEIPYRDPEASAAGWGCLIRPCCSGTGRWCFSFVGVATPPEWSGRFPAGRAAAAAHTASLTPPARCRWRATGLPPSPSGSNPTRIQTRIQIRNLPARPCLWKKAQSRHGSFFFIIIIMMVHMVLSTELQDGYWMSGEDGRLSLLFCAAHRWTSEPPPTAQEQIEFTQSHSLTAAWTFRGTQEEHADLSVTPTPTAPAHNSPQIKNIKRKRKTPYKKIWLNKMS